MATERSQLLGKKSFDYRTCVPLNLNTNQKPNEYIVVLPNVEETIIEERNSSLTMEELLLFKNDPWWVGVRRGLMISFILVFAAMFIASCIISMGDDKHRCPINVLNAIEMTGDALIESPSV